MSYEYDTFGGVKGTPILPHHVANYGELVRGTWQHDLIAGRADGPIGGFIRHNCLPCHALECLELANEVRHGGTPPAP